MKTLKFSNRYLFLALSAVMVLVVLLVTLVSSYLLYDTALRNEKNSIQDLAFSQVKLLESFIAELETNNSLNFNEPDYQKILEEFQENYPLLGGVAKTGELLIAHQNKGQQQFLVETRFHNPESGDFLPEKRTFAEPMKKALEGEFGTGILRDYRGEKVLAAYGFIEKPGLGVVVKIDLKEIQSPYITTALLSFSIGLIVTLIGLYVFFLISKRLSQNILSSEKHYRTLFNEASDGLAISSEVCESVNDHFLELFNGKTEDFIGKPLSAFFVCESDHYYNEEIKKDNQANDPLFDELISGYLNGELTEKSLPLYYKTKRINGGFFDSELILNTIELEGKKTVLVSVRDVSELYQAKQELDISLRNLVNAFISIDYRGNIERFNIAAEKMFGYQIKEVLGKNVSILMPEPDKSAHDSYIRNYQLTGEAKIIGIGKEVIGRKKDGTEFPVQLSIAELTTMSGGHSRFIATCIDLTEQKLQQEKLRRSQKMDALGKLTGGIAHDSNNMLGVILGYAELLEGRLSDQPKLAKFAHQIYVAGQRGAKLTSKLLSFSTQAPSQSVEVNINNSLLQQKLILEKTLTVNINIQLELAENLWSVWLDEDDLGNAIINICINAMHAMEGHGELLIGTRNIQLEEKMADKLEVSPGEYVILYFKDTGKGMDEYTMTRVFDPFFSTKGEQGSGLGLSQVYGFAQRSSGAVGVESNLEQGSQFTLYFPRYQSAQKSPEFVESKNINNSLKNNEKLILVVDDEVALLELLSEILTTNGYNVLTAENGVEALKLLADNDVDLVLSDVVMPEMDGFELLKEIQKSNLNIAVQLMSGYLGASEEEKLSISKSDSIDPQKNRIGQDILQKPLSSTRLLERIEMLLRDHTPNHS